jgi:hypothetical protein
VESSFSIILSGHVIAVASLSNQYGSRRQPERYAAPALSRSTLKMLLMPWPRARHASRSNLNSQKYCSEGREITKQRKKKSGSLSRGKNKMLYKYHEDPIVVTLHTVVYREQRYNMKEIADAAEVHRSLPYGWLIGKPAPRSGHVQRITRNLKDSVFLDSLTRTTPFRVIPRRVFHLPGIRELLYSYFAAQGKITQSPAFRKLMEGGKMTEEEANALRHAIREEQFTLDQLLQLIDEQIREQPSEEPKS